MFLMRSVLLGLYLVTGFSVLGPSVTATPNLKCVPREDGIFKYEMRVLEPGQLEIDPGTDYFSREKLINDSGEFAGTLQFIGSTTAEPMFQSDGVIENLFPIGSNGDVYDLNNVGLVGHVDVKAFYFDLSSRDTTDIHQILQDAFDISEFHSSVANNMNSNGLTVGTLIGESGAVVERRGFVFDSQTDAVTLLPLLPGAVNNYGRDVNDNGIIVGLQTFLGTNGRYRSESAFWIDGQPFSFPEEVGGPTAINNNNIATMRGGDLGAGFYDINTHEFHGLGVLPNFQNDEPWPIAINDQDVVLGHVFEVGSTKRWSFVYTEEMGMRLTQDFITVPSDWQNFWVSRQYDLNNRGEILAKVRYRIDGSEVYKQVILTPKCRKTIHDLIRVDAGLGPASLISFPR